MADKEVLSQEEIDALLHTVDETKDEDEPIEPASKKGADDAAPSKKKKSEPPPASDNSEQVKTINFKNQERIVRGELPVLDRIYDRAKRLFAVEIYQLTSKDFEIKQEPLVVMKHSEYMAGLPNPTLMNTYRFRPLRGKGLIAFDSTFIYNLVDYYFGGGSRFTSKKERSDFTATELKVMDSINSKLVSNLIRAWEPIISLNLMKVTEETNPQLIHISEADEMLMIHQFNINFGQETGSFSFVVPYSMLEPIKQQLELGASRPDDEIDPNWVKSLKEELMDVELLISSVMAEAKGTLGKVKAWKEGDFIPLEMKEIVTLDIEGTPSFSATLGSAGDKRALKILKKITY